MARPPRIEPARRAELEERILASIDKHVAKYANGSRPKSSRGFGPKTSIILFDLYGRLGDVAVPMQEAMKPIVVLVLQDLRKRGVIDYDRSLGWRRCPTEEKRSA